MSENKNQALKKMNKTALVIEDDVSENELLSEFLEVHGIKVVGRAFDGKEAIDLFLQNNPDFTIIDLLMPQYDGFFAIEGIQKINKKARILVLTGDASQESKKKLDDIGISNLIYKPCDLYNLMDFFGIKYIDSG